MIIGDTYSLTNAPKGFKIKCFRFLYLSTMSSNQSGSFLFSVIQFICESGKVNYNINAYTGDKQSFGLLYITQFIPFFGLDFVQTSTWKHVNTKIH